MDYALEAGNSAQRILPCPKCHAPVAVSGFTGSVRLKCMGCAFEEERVLSSNQLVTTLPLAVDLDRAPSGRSGKDVSEAGFRRALAKRPVSDRERAVVEYERTWSATWLAIRHAMSGDALEARVVLESALEALTLPAYRALVCAQLAQHAASQRAVDLAEKWIALAPVVSVLEVEAEIRTARAFLALAMDDIDEVLAYTRTASGHAVWLATALQMEALQRRGNAGGAAAILESVRQRQKESSLLVPMIAFGLGRQALVQVDGRSRVRDSLKSGLFVMIGSVVAALVTSHAITPVAISIALASGASALVSALTWNVGARSRGHQWLWRLSRWAIPLAFLLLSSARAAGVR